MTMAVEDEFEEFITEFKTTHLLLLQIQENHKCNEAHSSFQIGEWRCQQDESIEQVTYYSPNPNQILREIEYEGWRRHVATRRKEEGPRFIFHMHPSSNPLRVQADLARLIDDPALRGMGCWLEPLWLDLEDPILVVNFCEDSVEHNSEYVDELFNRINKVERIPYEIVMNLKVTIAHTCVEKFKTKIVSEGFTECLERTLQLLRPCSLKGVPSPFYVAAMFCREHNKIEVARTLIRHIDKMHWQYEEAREFERSTYNKQIEELLSRITYLEREKTRLQEEVLKIEPQKQERNTSLNSKATLDTKSQIHKTIYHHQFHCQPIIFSKIWGHKQQEPLEISPHKWHRKTI